MNKNKYRHISLSQVKFFFSHRCEPTGVGMGLETNPDTYSWDNSKREVFSLFQYTIDGEGFFRDGSREHRLTSGQAFLVNCPSDTAYRLPPGRTWGFVYVVFVGDMARYHVNEIIAKHGHVLSLPATSAAVETVRRLYADAFAGIGHDKYWLSAAVYRFLMELYRELDPRDEIPPGIRRAVQRIEHDYRNPGLGLDELATEAGLSRFHFARLFRRHTGMSPYAHLLKVRMNQAMDHLISTDLNVKEISRLCGFNDFSYFCRTFRKHNGKSPGRMRRKREL